MKTLVTSLLMGTSLAAQSLHVVPVVNTSSDAPSRSILVGSAPERTQVVIDASMLGGLIGHRIDALLFRRDGALSTPLLQGSWNVVLRIGIASQVAAAALPDYARNANGLVELFRGTVTVPASPVPTGTPTWTSSDVVRIDLAPSFTYSSGGLVVDIETHPQGSDWWPIDAIDEPVAGTVSEVGVPCGRFVGWPATASCNSEDLVIGRTVRWKVQGEPSAPAFLLIGGSTLAQPLDMSVIGAPGCLLHVMPFAALGTTVGAPQFTPEFGGAAWVDLHLPANAELLGASLTTQWFEWQAAGFAFSNALECQLSVNAPSLGMALVTGQLAGTPVVRSYGIPVIGFVTD